MTGFYYRYLKRAIDFTVALILLMLISPLLLAVYLAIKLTSPGPAFFLQQRAGYHGHAFQIYKFRSMVITHHVNPAEQVYLDDPGITPVGHFIRRFKIDELPQLWNVLIGDMSLVGPRPTLVEHMKDYTPEQARRLDVTPGLTGWAQVNGNVMLGLPQRLQHDVWYVDHLSFWLDVKILLMTIGVVLFGEKVKASK